MEDLTRVFCRQLTQDLQKDFYGLYVTKDLLWGQDLVKVFERQSTFRQPIFHSCSMPERPFERLECVEYLSKVYCGPTTFYQRFMGGNLYNFFQKTSMGQKNRNSFRGGLVGANIRLNGKDPIKTEGMSSSIYNIQYTTKGLPWAQDLSKACNVQRIFRKQTLHSCSMERRPFKSFRWIETSFKVLLWTQGLDKLFQRPFLGHFDRRYSMVVLWIEGLSKYFSGSKNLSECRYKVCCAAEKVSLVLYGRKVCSKDLM